MEVYIIISPQECSAIIAYLNVMTTLNGKPEQQDTVKTDVPLIPHREEKVGRPPGLPRLKLAELLAQDPGYAEHIAAVKAAGLKPHREEKKGRPPGLPRLKLADLLATTRDKEPDGEWDTGPDVGYEIW